MAKSKKLNRLWRKVTHVERDEERGSVSGGGTGMSVTSSRSRGSSERTVSVASWEEDGGWSSAALDVPAGSLPVYVGEERRRFVIPTSYLSSSIFRALLERSEEEYGLRCQGGLRIACAPEVFEHFLWWLEGEA